ncbi:hypothetical protein L3Q82_005650 [Scortum barcoo]|uniref:Uncharacterized protein n=1 Tax=Scortum barcoo TaxID=214431 RepID=A0ACB8V6D9_9TELE|nr:hypothetical protein L3Q82_005650 [Scortum barcoo]
MAALSHGGSYPPTATRGSQSPMQIGRTRLSPEERACRRQGNLCLYCGQAGHFISRCPAKGTDSPVERGSNDSGADVSLIDEELALQLGITRIPLSKAISASALDGHLLGTVTHQTGAHSHVAIWQPP